MEIIHNIKKPTIIGAETLTCPSPAIALGKVFGTGFQVIHEDSAAAKEAARNIELAAELAGGHGAKEQAIFEAQAHKPMQIVFGA